VSALTGTGLGALESAILRRARPEPERFVLRIPYTDGRAIASVRASFRVVDEHNLGDALWLSVAGERKKLGALSRFEEPVEEAVRIVLRAR
jgi:50S ribosomal subunit-associated GTPase HflX